MALPELGQLANSDNALFERVHAALKGRRDGRWRDFAPNDVARIGEELREPLCDSLIARGRRQPRVAQDQAEREAVLAFHATSLDRNIGPAIKFCMEHFSLRRRQLKERGCSLPDDTGGSLLYPETVPALRRVGRLIRMDRAVGPDHNSLFHAALMFVAFLNAHPLADGNGRTARFLFNSILLRSYNGPFIPLYGLSLASDGALVLALRDASYKGRWSRLARFIAAAVSHAVS